MVEANRYHCYHLGRQFGGAAGWIGPRPNLPPHSNFSGCFFRPERTPAALPRMELQRMKSIANFIMFLSAISWSLPAVISRAATAAIGIKQPHLHLRIQADGHPCGIFHSSRHQMFTISIANLTSTPLILRGKLRWQFCSGPRPTHWHTLLAVPIAPALVAMSQRFTIHFPVAFDKVGFYRLIYQHRDIASASGSVFTCIRRPAGLIIPTPLSPWIRNLPARFCRQHPPGYIADYIHQTSIRRYIFRLCWPPKPTAASRRRPPISPTQVKKIAQSLIRHRAVLVLAVQLRNDLADPAATPRRFTQFLAPWLRAAGTDLAAMAIAPPAGRCSFPALRLVRQLCLRGYATALAINPQVKVLGDPALRALRFSGKSSAAAGNPLAIVNIWTLPSQRRTFRRHLSWLTGKTPVWVLPPRSGGLQPQGSPGRVAPALALAQGATVVPAPHHDFGLAEHWLGGASLFHIVHPYLPPFIAAFQGNHHCVAVLAGLGAATMRDQQWSAVRYWPVHRIHHLRLAPAAATHVPTGTLIVLDPAHDMQATTSHGQPLTSPIAGWHEIPLNSHTYYLESTGSVVNLVAALRTATLQGLPPVALAAFLNTSRPAGLMVAVRNGRLGRLRGSIRVKVADAAFSRWQKFRPIPSGQSAIIGPFGVPLQPGFHANVLVQIRRNGVTWQTAGSIESSAPTTSSVTVPAPPNAEHPTTQTSPTTRPSDGVYHLRIPVVKTLH